MAQSSFPFESIDTTETQFSQMFRNLQDGVNGTYGGSELQVSVGTGLAVDVALGQAMVRGHYYISTATESLSLSTADATNDRLDTVVLKLDPSANSVTLAVKTGTPAGSPSAPTLVQTDAGVYEMPLANVLVPATSGVPTTITDRREYMGTRIGLWSDDTRPTDAFPHVGFNTTSGSFEGYDPVAATWGAIGGGGGVTISDTAPSSPADGDLWWESDTGALYVYYDDGSSQQWVAAAGGMAVMSDTAPAGYNGQLWWDTGDGKMYVYYDDGTSSAWVAANGPQVTVQATAPAGYQGQMWLDSTDGSMYVYYTDPGGGSSSWIGAVSRSGGILQVVSTTKTDTFSTTSTSFTDVTGLSATITPRSTSSKILVMVTAQVSDSADYVMQTQLLRDSTAIFVGDASGSTTRASTHSFNDFVANDDLEIVNNAFQHLDSPSTTSSVTYKIQLKTSGGTAYVNRTASATDSASRSRVASSITLMEVAG